MTIAKKILIGVIALTAVTLGSCFAYTYLHEGVFNGVSVAGTSLSAMTEQEASVEISKHAEEIISNSNLTIKLGENEFSAPVNTFITEVDSEGLAERAYNYAREGNPFERMTQAVSALFVGAEIDASSENIELATKVSEFVGTIPSGVVEPHYELSEDNTKLMIYPATSGYEFDRTKLVSDVLYAITTLNVAEPIEVKDATIEEPQSSGLSAETIKAEVDKPMVNAALTLTEDKRSYTGSTPEQVGVSVELALLQEALAKEGATVYEVPVTVTMPTATQEMLNTQLFADELSSVTTSLNAGNVNRTTNVRLSANSVNGLILNPGDEFSYNDSVGPRTSARGYKEAIVFANGGQEEGLGGGICQTSSTLYMATLYADLQVTERKNHSLRVSYTPIGQDATVVYGVIDYKFVNNTPYPMKISAVQSGSYLTIKFLGTKTTDKVVKIESIITGSTPYKTITVENPDMAPGTSKTTTTPYTGYSSVVYKYVTENGETIKSKVNNSSYKVANKVVEVGPAVEPTVTPTDPTMPPTTTDPENPTPTPTPEPEPIPTPTPTPEPEPIPTPEPTPEPEPTPTIQPNA